MKEDEKKQKKQEAIKMMSRVHECYLAEESRRKEKRQ